LRHQLWLGTFGREDRERLFKEAYRPLVRENDVFAAVLSALGESAGMGEENALLYSYRRSYMMDEVMVKVDRASMFVSLETRSPFLDRSVVEFVDRLPYRYKLNGWTTKYILKRLMSGRLPEHIVHRTKKGFGVPMAEWLSGPLGTMTRDLLHSSESRKYFDEKYLESLFAEHRSGARDHRKKLWNLVAFLLWAEHYG
jgi:asparagine synthase (glutamine-hydrolysing)